MGEWQKKLAKMLQKKQRDISGYNPDALSMRVDGYVGRELDESGYSQAIFYLQLTPKINLDVVASAVHTISRNLGSKYKNGYFTVFLNDEEGKLIYPSPFAKYEKQAVDIIKDYYARYAKQNEACSRTLNQIFPYKKGGSFPSQSCLYVLFQDEEGIKFNENILLKVNQFRKTFIIITCEAGKEVIIDDIRVPIKV